MLAQDSENNVSDAGTDAKVQISDDEGEQPKLNGINNVEATITAVNNTTEDSEIFQYFNGHKTNHHHAVNGVVAATE